MPAPKHPTTTATIVVADDDNQVLRLMTRNLQLEGYRVVEARDGQQAVEQIQDTQPDLALVDLQMPRLDGLAVTQVVRTVSQVPIILVTARIGEQDKLRGFELGADDYLTKPFSVEELLARVRAQLRRAKQGSKAAATPSRLVPRVTVGDLVIDLVKQRVTRGSLEITLTPMEYRLLAILAANAGRLVTREQLVEQVWGPAQAGEDAEHLLHVHVYRLRQKIEPDPKTPRYLLTRTGFGYLLAAPPAA